VSRDVKAKEKAKVVALDEGLGLGEFVCAIGVFDGVHRGHQFIIGEAVRQADELGIPSVVITFDRDPDELFCPPEQQRKLLSNADRIDRLAHCGTDKVLVIPFDATFAVQTPFDFLNATVAAQGAPRGIHVGADFRFGLKATGTVDDLRSWGASRGCETFASTLLSDEGLPVTSTRIRNALEAGELAVANRLLTRPHYLRAQVVSGCSRGRKLGFATANLSLKQQLVRPADGVYAGLVPWGERRYKAAISVGVPATFEGTPATIEAHLLDFEGDLYGSELEVFFLEYLRPMRAFSSVEELKSAVQANIAHVRTHHYDIEG
jgi:riboflavin kinase/FMN adenylyltransferase